MSVVERVLVPEVVTESERRARILEAAALEIEVRGWAQGWCCAPEGQVCLGGAILAAEGRELALSTITIGCAGADAWDAIETAFGKGGPDATAFNDHTANTADEVTFLLRWRAQEIRDGR
jgi:hypothetical protein